MATGTRLYDNIGEGYAARRGEDPALRDRLVRALSDCASVVNVGAGTGSYEPAGKQVVPVLGIGRAEETFQQWQGYLQ